MSAVTHISTADDVWNRGHGPKILEGLRSAETKRVLPANPRPVEFRRIVLVELSELNYRDLPSRTAIDVRYDALYRPTL
jgi:hypothetical protein